MDSAQLEEYSPDLIFSGLASFATRVATVLSLRRLDSLAVSFSPIVFLVIASAIADNGEMNAIIKCAQGATHLYPDTQYDVSINYGTWTSPSYIEKYNLDLSENAKIGYMYTRFENTVKDGLELLIAEVKD